MIFIIGLSFFTTLAIIYLLLNSRFRTIGLDQPNDRSLHQIAIPRTGGLAIMSSVLFAWIAIAGFSIWLLLATVLLAISLLDDFINLSVKSRFILQIGICFAFIYCYLSPDEWILNLILLIGMTWVVNLYNFMDGSDGLAGGMTLCGFMFYGLAAYLSADMHIAYLSFAIAASAIAFLIFNFNPARIFMGDGGSIPLGFLAGSIGLYGWWHGLWAIWFPVLVFSPFIMDASVTLIKRLIRGEKFWQAHRSHYYQRLVQMGVGHKMTAIYEYMLMLAVGATALLLNGKNVLSVIIAIIVWILIYSIILISIDQYWKQFTQVNTVK